MRFIPLFNRTNIILPSNWSDHFSGSFFQSKAGTNRIFTWNTWK